MAEKDGARDIADSSSIHEVVTSSRGLRNFLMDDPQTMTFGRKIALYCMKHYKWYNHRLGEEDDDEADMDRGETSKPSIEKAWEYFEHVSLQR